MRVFYVLCQSCDAMTDALSLTYLLLSRTYGMHLYTADLARAVLDAGGAVHLVTVADYPAHAYDPRVQVHAIWPAGVGTMSPQPLLDGAVRRVIAAVRDISPDVVHITGPQLLTPLVARRIRALGIPVIHTLHDLDPHPGAVYGRLLHLWNRAVMASVDRILIHARRYLGHVPGNKAAYLPLLHLFLGHAALERLDNRPLTSIATPRALFFGRVARYKGVDVLLRAWEMAAEPGWELVIAGQGEPAAEPPGPLPPGVIRRNALIGDVEAIALFESCAVLVLPYTGATQSALIPAAYRFGRPVIITDSGALPEYVVQNETGWVVPPNDVPALADALCQALSDLGRCKRLGVAGRAWYDEQRADERAGLLALYDRMRHKR